MPIAGSLDSPPYTKFLINNLKTPTPMIPFLAVIKKYKILFIIILVVIANAVALYTMYLSREKTRLTQDYAAVNTPVKATKKGDATIYTHPVETITMAQFKDVFKQEFDYLKKDLDLKAIQSVVNVNTETIKNITTSVRDTLIRDTIHAKTWTYEDKSLKIRTIEIGEIRQTNWKHNLDLTLVKSKQPRVGIKKLFIWQSRPLIFNAIPSDTNTIINKLSLKEIK